MLGRPCGRDPSPGEASRGCVVQVKAGVLLESTVCNSALLVGKDRPANPGAQALVVSTSRFLGHC